MRVLLMALGMVWSVQAAAVTAASENRDEPVRTLDRPFQRANVASTVASATPVAIPARDTMPAVPAPGGSAFSLTSEDLTVPRAFERWARERRVQLRWLVGRDHGVDAVAGHIAANAEDLALVRQAGSVDPELTAALIKVARAFAKSKHPFVIREMDNVILVQPKSAERQ